MRCKHKIDLVGATHRRPYLFFPTVKYFRIEPPHPFLAHEYAASNTENASCALCRFAAHLECHHRLCTSCDITKCVRSQDVGYLSFPTDVGWVAVISGVFAIVWGLLRTGVVVPTLHQTFERQKKSWLSSLAVWNNPFQCYKQDHPIMIFGRYARASARCGDWISSLPARSAIVRASFTLRVRR